MLIQIQLAGLAVITIKQFVLTDSNWSHGIVLIVSESPPTATWIPRGANPYLVDEAISIFDKDFTAGVDVYQGVDGGSDSKS